MFSLLLLVAMLCSSSPESRAASNFVTLIHPSPSAGIFVNVIVSSASSSRSTTSSDSDSTTARHPLVFLKWHTELPKRGGRFHSTTLSHVRARIRNTDTNTTDAHLPLQPEGEEKEGIALHCHNDTCRDGPAQIAYSPTQTKNHESTITIETPLMFVLLASIVLSLRRCTRTQGQQCNVSSLLPNMMSLLAIALFAACAEDWWNQITTSASFATWNTLGEAYMGYLESHPIATKSLSAGVIAMIGDYCAQWTDFALQGDGRLTLTLQHPNKDNCCVSDVNDGGRTITTAASPARVEPSVVSIYGRYSARRGFAVLADGILITGPLMHLGFEAFERWMPIAGATNDPAAANIAAVLHVVADTLILDSFFVAFCFVSTGLLEGMPRDKLLLQFKSDCWSSLLASWATSVALCPIQFCFFRYLPLQLRVLSVNSIDLVWGAVQSFMSHRNRHH